MQVESLACNNCGAPLEVPQNANYATCAHCGSQLAIRRTESAHYTEVLQRLDDRSQAMSQDLETIRLQNEIERLDREWAIEREKYRVEGGRGSSSSLPTSGNTIIAVIVGIIVILFGIFWTTMAVSMTSSSPFGGGGFGGPSFPGESSPQFGIGSCFPLFGVAFVLVAIIVVVSQVVKAGGYSQAEQEYLRKRETLMRDLQQRG